MKKITLLFILIYPLSIWAQKKGENPFRISKLGEEAMSLHVSGFVPMDYLGGRIGTDIPIKITEKRGFKGFHAGRDFREWYINAELGWFHKPQIYENFMVSAELLYRRIEGVNGWFWQISPIGVGGNYVLPSNFRDSVKVPVDTVKNPLLGRRWYVTPSVSVGFGRDFALRKGRRSGLPLVIYGKVGINSMLPYKKFGYLVPTAELGFSYRFAGMAIATRQVRRS